jgi:hypothetical protein
LSIRCVAAETGFTADVSSMKPPKYESSPSPMGRSSEIGYLESLRTRFVSSTEILDSLAISSSEGSRPLYCVSFRATWRIFVIASIMWTGMRIVRPWSAMARVIA